MSTVNVDDDKKPSSVEEKLEIENKNKNKRRRLFRHDKRRSKERKNEAKYKKSWQEYDNFMNANIDKKRNYHESPHIVICRSLNLIIQKSIIMKRARVIDDKCHNRKIYYEIDYIGSDIDIKKKSNKYQNIQLNDTVSRKIFILAPFKTFEHESNIIYFDEFGNRMNVHELSKISKAYVVLAMAKKSNKIENNGLFIDRTDLELAKKIWINQIKSDETFHFATTGNIYGLGFGPKYFVNEKTNLSLG